MIVSGEKEAMMLRILKTVEANSKTAWLIQFRSMSLNFVENLIAKPSPGLHPAQFRQFRARNCNWQTESKTGEMAQRVLNALKTGIKTQTQLHEAFGRHVTVKELRAALAELEARGLVKSCRSGGGFGKGRPVTAWSLSLKASSDRSARGGVVA